MEQPHRRLAVFALVWVLSLGCGGNEPSEQPAPGGAKQNRRLNFSFVTNAVANFWTIAKKGIDDAAEEFDVLVEFRMPPTGSISEQKQIIEDAFNNGIDGLAVSPIDAENQTEFLKEMAGYIPLLCHDSDAPESGRLAYVGTDNYQAGREAGKLIKEAIPEGGKIMLFVGRLDAQNAQERKRGIEEELAGSNVEIIDTRTDETDTLKARSNAEDTLLAHPDVKCLVGLWSYNGPAIAAAVEAADKVGEVQVVCFDEDDATLEAIARGVIHGTVVQQPYQMGYQTIRILTEYVRGNKEVIPANQIIDTGVQIVRQENVEEFKAELENLLGP
jgi:ribose transport system substrate-binding protein